MATSLTLGSSTRVCSSFSKRRAGVVGALAVVGVGGELPLRGPREQDRNRRRAQVMVDLSEPIDRILEWIVIAVDEHQDAPLTRVRRSAFEELS